MRCGLTYGAVLQTPGSLLHSPDSQLDLREGRVQRQEEGEGRKERGGRRRVKGGVDVDYALLQKFIRVPLAYLPLILTVDRRIVRFPEIEHAHEHHQ